MRSKRLSGYSGLRGSAGSAAPKLPKFVFIGVRPAEARAEHRLLPFIQS